MDVRNRMLRFIEKKDTQRRHIQALQAFDKETVMTDHLVYWLLFKEHRNIRLPRFVFTSFKSRRWEFLY